MPVAPGVALPLPLTAVDRREESSSGACYRWFSAVKSAAVAWQQGGLIHSGAGMLQHGPGILNHFCVHRYTIVAHESRFLASLTPALTSV
jgi:hypothetical protein